jgi:hypothetical protein
MQKTDVAFVFVQAFPVFFKCFMEINVLIKVAFLGEGSVTYFTDEWSLLSMLSDMILNMEKFLKFLSTF